MRDGPPVLYDDEALGVSGWHWPASRLCGDWDGRGASMGEDVALVPHACLWTGGSGGGGGGGGEEGKDDERGEDVGVAVVGMEEDAAEVYLAVMAELWSYFGAVGGWVGCVVGARRRRCWGVAIV